MKTIPLDLKKEDRILIVAPHPDDESIGVGGLLALYSSQCDVLVMTDGRYGNEQYCVEEMIKVRRCEFQQAMDIVGLKNRKLMGNEDGSLIVNSCFFEDIDISSYTHIFLPNPSDHHSDHTACYKYFMKNISKTDNPIKIYQYEVHNPLAEVSVHLDISDAIEKKKRMVECYSSQMCTHNYPDQVVNLARFRALQNEADGRYFETYLQVFDDNYECGTEIELAKYKWFTRVFSRLLDLSKKDGGIGNNLCHMGYRNVAIYGYGIVGKKLYKLLEESDCNVECIIDVNIGKPDNRVPLFNDISHINQPDIVIITLFSGTKEIAEIIEEQCQIKTIGINELFGL